MKCQKARHYLAQHFGVVACICGTLSVCAEVRNLLEMLFVTIIRLSCPEALSIKASSLLQRPFEIRSWKNLSKSWSSLKISSCILYTWNEQRLYHRNQLLLLLLLTPLEMSKAARISMLYKRTALWNNSVIYHRLHLSEIAAEINAMKKKWKWLSKQ